ncbi:hypothetical protein GDO81_007635 [Engystomops pustulosus]|uniref:Uncharacterized protein n=1 Tax=Engystomops pustulosus TaxID=76066 RepID=A0AAV7CA95_ENGPU|nr:hypothetical protein GDO81_007635 [Engystomops pustulosus]
MTGSCPVALMEMKRRYHMVGRSLRGAGERRAAAGCMDGRMEGCDRYALPAPARTRLTD